MKGVVSRVGLLPSGVRLLMVADESVGKGSHDVADHAPRGRVSLVLPCLRKALGPLALGALLGFDATRAQSRREKGAPMKAEGGGWGVVGGTTREKWGSRLASRL